MIKSKNIVSKTTSILFAVLLVFALMIGFANLGANQSIGTLKADPTIVDSGSCGEGVTYTLDSDGLLTISGTGAMTCNDSNRGWKQYDSSVTKVKINDGVSYISQCAFADLTNLTEIEFPETSIEFGLSVFANCTSLTVVTIPSNVTVMRNGDFGGCTNLRSIIVNSDTPITLQEDKGYLTFFCGGTDSSDYGTFIISAEEAHIYVPDDYVNLYQSSWSGYADYIVAVSQYVSSNSNSNQSGNGSNQVEQTGIILDVVLPSFAIVLVFASIILVAKKQKNY